MESVIIDYHEAKRIFEEALTVMTSIGQSKSKAIEDLTFYEPFIHHKEQLLKDFMSVSIKIIEQELYVTVFSY